MSCKKYRSEKKSLQILLSSTQAEPGRKVKQEQEDISRNHVPRLFLGSVQLVGRFHSTRGAGHFFGYFTVVLEDAEIKHSNCKNTITKNTMYTHS